MKTDLQLNRFLSATSLVLGFIVCTMVKFYLYNVKGFGLVWNEKHPGSMEQFKEFLELTLGGYTLLVLAAAVLADKFLWPYFYRKEVKEIREIHETDVQ